MTFFNNRSGGPRGIARIGGALVLTALIGGAWWRSGGWNAPIGGARAYEGRSESVAREDSERLAIPVVIDTVREGALVLKVSATGQTEASARATIAPRVAGRIGATLVEEGDRVGRGRPLVRLDDREYALSVLEAKAELELALARYREMTLFDERTIDPTVREQRARAVRARTGLDSAQIALRRAELDLAGTTIAAPFRGQVANVLASPGEYVTAGQELLTLVTIDPIEVEVQVVESDLASVVKGYDAQVLLPAFPDTLFRGRIASINPVLDPETRTARVKVLLRNPEGHILPGMFSRVILDGRVSEDRVLVPVEALIERDGRTFVFVFEPLEDGRSGEGLAKWVYVTPGRSNGEFVELLKAEENPVVPGTLVITGGNTTLIHDARVRVAPGGPARP